MRVHRYRWHHDFVCNAVMGEKGDSGTKSRELQSMLGHIQRCTEETRDMIDGLLMGKSRAGDQYATPFHNSSTTMGIYRVML